MAASRYAVVFLLPPPSTPARKFFLKPIIRSSLSISPLPSKPSKRRKNHLRPKILETLTKPLQTQEPLRPLSNAVVLEPPSHQVDSLEEEGDGFRVSSSVVEEQNNGIVGKFSPNSVLKYGIYFIGLFAFQTVLAVWVLGNGNSDQKVDNFSDISSDKSDFDSERNRGKILFNGERKYVSEKSGFKPNNVIYLNEVEMMEKIEKIREMAREARRIEKKKGKDGDDEEAVEGKLDFRMGIEKEIGARLANAEQRLNSQRKGLAGLSMKGLDELWGEDEEETGVLDGEEGNGSLMFKKKYRFKNEKPPGNVKGFPGRDNGRVVAKSKNGGFTGIDTEDVVDEDGKGKQGLNGNLISLLDGVKKSESMRKKAGSEDPPVNSHAVQETNPGALSYEVNQSRTERNSGRQNLNFTKENPDMDSESQVRGFLNQEGSSKPGEVGRKSLARKVKESHRACDLWWLKLPYVLGVLMRGDIDQQRAEGLFTLRAHSQAPNSDAYTVVFEDHGDAKNFSYLLGSFFEDLGDFSADIVCIPTKDLHEEVQSGGKKVIVVRKRQLQLYAGQPLQDVEAALHSLIEKN